MEDYSYDEDYTYYDGSSAKTSLTPYSTETKMGGSGVRSEKHAIDGVKQACRTSCDVLRCLAMTFSSIDRKDGDNLQQMRSHRLRIVDSNGRDWNKPVVYAQSKQDRPIRWKNKGSSRVTLQESLSTDVSSTVSSWGQEGNEWRERSTTKKTSYPNKRMDPLEDNRSQLSGFDMERDGAVMESPKISHVKDIQTVDSRIIQRRRQQRQKVKKKDSVSFRYPDTREVIDDYDPTELHLHRNQKQPLGHHALFSSQERVESGETIGESKKGILKPGHRVSLENITSATVDAASPSNLWDLRRKKRIDANQNTSEIVSGQAPAAYQTDSMPLTSDFAAPCQRENQDADKAQHVFGNIQQSNSNSSFHHHAPSLDAVVFHGLENQSNQIRDASQRKTVYSESAVEARLNRGISFCRHESISQIRDPMVDLRGHVAVRDEFDGTRDLHGARDAFSLINSKEADEEMSLLVSSVHASTLPASKAEAYRPPRSATNSSSSSSSTLSLRSFNSDRHAKERWLRSRPSFDNHSGDTQSLLAGRERRATKGRKPWSATSVSKAEATKTQANAWSSASVVSVDRKARKPNINARREGEATSVL